MAGEKHYREFVDPTSLDLGPDRCILSGYAENRASPNAVFDESRRKC